MEGGGPLSAQTVELGISWQHVTFTVAQVTHHPSTTHPNPPPSHGTRPAGSEIAADSPLPAGRPPPDNTLSLSPSLPLPRFLSLVPSPSPSPDSARRGAPDLKAHQQPRTSPRRPATSPALAASGALRVRAWAWGARPPDPPQVQAAPTVARRVRT